MMDNISVNVPHFFIVELGKLVEDGHYANRSEAIRVAIRDLIEKEGNGGGDTA